MHQLAVYTAVDPTENDCYQIVKCFLHPKDAANALAKHNINQVKSYSFLAVKDLSKLITKYSVNEFCNRLNKEFGITCTADNIRSELDAIVSASDDSKCLTLLELMGFSFGFIFTGKGQRG